METSRCPLSGLGASMSRKLPAAGTIDDFKKEARGLLHSLRRSDAATITRYISFDSEESVLPSRLADAQYVIARMYGCRGWKHLEERVKRREYRRREFFS
jgi:hypothetical protein